MGEVAELEDAVDQRQADRAERQDRSGDDADDQRVALFQRRPDDEQNDQRPEPAAGEQVAEAATVAEDLVAQAGEGRLGGCH